MPVVSRDELHALVWRTPMSRLATDFGLTGNGLAKICDRLDIPYPPRGYWAKKEAGKPVIAFKLPKRKAEIPESVEIRASEPKPVRDPAIQRKVEHAITEAANVSNPETPGNQHPKVRAWIAEHKQLQKEREKQRRKRPRDPWSWTPEPIIDLTERDLYRFRFTSTLLYAVEKAGDKIGKTPLSGKLIFLIDNEEVECAVVEKMVRPLKKPEGDAAKWTAFPERHQTGLHSSGFLRVEITTYFNSGRQRRWIETTKKKIGIFLPNIVGEIIAAGPTLASLRREREERERRYQQEAAERYEQKKLKEQGNKRWSRFRDLASDWEESRRLEAFLSALREKIETEGDTMVRDRSMTDWITWADARLSEMDPKHRSAADIFDTVAEDGLPTSFTGYGG